MTQWILDTDHVSAILRGNRKAIDKSAIHYPHVAITIITVQELFNGWIGKLNQEQDPSRLVRLYGNLAQTVRLIKTVQVLDFDEPSKQAYLILRQQPTLAKKRLEKDLRIASVALSQKATMVTRNHKDFSLVPNLKLEDWIS